MTAQRRDPASRTRISVVCSVAQSAIVVDAAKAARSDTSTWMLAHALRAALVPPGAGSPLVVTGPVADRLRALADGQGISADKALEQLLIATGG